MRIKFDMATIAVFAVVLAAFTTAAAWINIPHDPAPVHHKWYQSGTCGTDKCEYVDCRDDETPGQIYDALAETYGKQNVSIVDDGYGRVLVTQGTLQTGFYSTPDACQAAIQRMKDQFAAERAEIDKYR